MSPTLQQKQLFSQALSVHQNAKSVTDFRNALSLYEQSSSAAKPTFPILFNISAVCFSLSEILSKQESHSYRHRAASSLETALSILPNNLEALIARAAVEDTLATACAPAQVFTHRERATQWLKRGATVEPNDASVRILLSESFVLLAEAGVEQPHFRADESLSHAHVALREAQWLLQMKTADLKQQPSIPVMVEALRDDSRSAKHMAAKIALASIRLTAISDADAIRLLSAAQDELSTETEEDVLVTRAEVLESLAERDSRNARIWLKEAGAICKTISGDRRSEALTLLGDVCLALARLGEFRAFEEGIAAYEATLDEQNMETLYNLACLIALGLEKGVDGFGGETRVRQLLRRATDAGGVTIEEILEDDDLRQMRCRSWFGNIVKLAQRQNRQQP